MPEVDNRMVWDRRPGHYEVWYATATHLASGTGFWIRYTLEAPAAGHGEPWAQLWFARFDPNDPAATFGINRRFPISALATVDDPFSLSVGESRIRHDGMRGELSGAGKKVRWDLAWRPAASTLKMLPSFAYKTRFAVTKAHSPNQSVAASGEIVVDGKRYAFDGDPLGQTHLWGRKHAYAWAWGHCNGFSDRSASLETLSVRLKRGSIILPTLTLFTLFLDGEEIQFREPWKMPMARSDWSTGHYRVAAVSPDTRVEATFHCRPDDMVLAEYLDPDGDPAFCHNSCCADAEVTVWKRSPFVGRWREHRHLTARHAGHFEWGGRAGDALHVKKMHAAVG